MNGNFDKDSDKLKEEPGSNYDSGNINYKNTQQEFKSFIMDDRGRIRRSGAAGVVDIGAARTYISLGWVFAALALLVSPYFALAGITLGFLANRQTKGSGTYIIIANTVLALINYIFGSFFIVTLRRIIFGGIPGSF